MLVHPMHGLEVLHEALRQSLNLATRGRRHQGAFVTKCTPLRNDSAYYERGTDKRNPSKFLSTVSSNAF